MLVLVCVCVCVCVCVWCRWRAPRFSLSLFSSWRVLSLILHESEDVPTQYRGLTRATLLHAASAGHQRIFWLSVDTFVKKYFTFMTCFFLTAVWEEVGGGEHRKVFVSTKRYYKASLPYRFTHFSPV